MKAGNCDAMGQLLTPPSPSLLHSTRGYMPKVESPPHFDAEGIVAAVQEQDIGLRITTNNPERCRQILYKAAAKLGKRLHIYSYPKRPNSFALLKEARPQLKEESNG